MEKSSERAHSIEAALAAFRSEEPDLVFPVEPDFISKPPRIDPQVMFKRCEEMLQYQVSKPGFYERRLADKIDVEFVL
jgi:hypothetical protein